ncbi:loricrin-like [Pyrus ussuriensis x Pyrus communis]|uniref:Loricrin-like n=1 Tax=Pyrus ussuriensis x Pyrus communis TaxID=2448454 RepID=A0A5N5GDG2_9ROSA|nr:loricrin-like [Pyrus ussuriensis x Pyrus communis]
MKIFKTLILLGLLFGSVVLISSAVEAETTKDEKKNEPKEVNQGGGGRYCGRCCYRYGRYTCGGQCCWPAEQSEVVVTDEGTESEALEDNFETKQPDGYGGWGGGGRGGGSGGRGGGGGGGGGGRGRGGGGSGGGGGGGGGRGGGGWGGGGRGGGGGN